MKSILPPDGGPLVVYTASLASAWAGYNDLLVFVEVGGGPFITLTPHQWNDLVRRIRAAPSAASLGA